MSVRLWFEQFPESSVKRLRHINQSATSARHVLLALAYGTVDENIAKLNRVITGLLLARLKAERTANFLVVARINTFMTLMHEEMDKLTGHHSSPGLNDGNVCNRPPGRKAMAG